MGHLSTLHHSTAPPTSMYAAYLSPPHPTRNTAPFLRHKCVISCLDFLKSISMLTRYFPSPPLPSPPSVSCRGISCIVFSRPPNETKEDFRVSDVGGPDRYREEECSGERESGGEGLREEEGNEWNGGVKVRNMLQANHESVVGMKGTAVLRYHCWPIWPHQVLTVSC